MCDGTTLTMGITGLFFMVEVLGFEGASWRSLTRPVLSTLLGALLVAGFLLTVYTPALRRFFDFTEVQTGDWVIVLSAVAGALLGQWALSRYWEQFLNLLIAKPGGPCDNRPASPAAVLDATSLFFELISVIIEL